MLFPAPKVEIAVFPDPEAPSRYIKGLRLLRQLRLPILIDRYPEPLPIRIDIPKGFLSDGASVPRIFWRLLSPPIDPVTITPSIAHDYLYIYGSELGLTRAEVDAWYANALYQNGYPLWKSILTYIGVRLGGASRWH